MTTIAWDGMVLAGDTLSIMGDNLKQSAQKIYRLPDGRMYGGCGDLQDVLAVHAWLVTGGCKPPIDQNFSALVIDTLGNCAKLENRLIMMPVHAPYIALGSGRDFAIAAMALSQCAEDAVRLAAQFDVWTGDVVETLSLEPLHVRKE